MITRGARERASRYLARAHQALSAGDLALAHGDYITSVNRAYYVIFYSANALLSTQSLERSKHSGVIAAFRQHFIKTGLVEAEYSDIYGAVLEDRAEGDYDLEFEPSADEAAQDMMRARRFLTRIENALLEMDNAP